MILGQRIKEARLKLKMSQEDLGDKLGVTKVSVCGYENGTRTPTMKVFLSLIDVLDLEPNYILGRDVLAVSEEDEEYSIKLSKFDFEIINELKKETKLYQQLCIDPKRTVELIIKKMNK